MEQLASMKYHPLRDHKLINSGDKEHKKKRKKLKTSIICKSLKLCHFDFEQNVACNLNNKLKAFCFTPFFLVSCYW
jgi:hypothetical protein